MDTFRFRYPISVRYGDLDPQWHVNNARFLSYTEQTRFAYLLELGLFDGHSFQELPLIVADVHCRYHAPISANVTVVVSTGVINIGNKSLTMGSTITSEDGKTLHAELETVMVGYDYHTKSSMPIPDEIRARVEAYEGKTFQKKG